MNPVYFTKMAHGDLAGLRELAFDYFNDTRRLMTSWMSMLESGNFGRLREELHRCKGGASLFGLERIVALIGNCESPTVLEVRGFDLVTFEQELTAAERAVSELTDSKV
jgi:HPt (histidine-containing phosphotransfer) domain-containing protein